MKAVVTMVRTCEAYEAAFQTARLLEYPEVDAFEQRMGFGRHRQTLESAARVLACPLKANAPHWQHGRVVYSAARYRLESLPVDDTEFVTLLDVGTAKGFSAVCLYWALGDAHGIGAGEVYSVDVVDPMARVSRNSVADCDELLTVPELVRDYTDDDFPIRFEQSTGIDWLVAHAQRIHVAFIDGKHDGHVVRQEGKLLAALQQCGDLAIFDDCQIPAVCQAVVSLQEFYKVDYITAGPREYAVGWRR